MPPPSREELLRSRVYEYALTAAFNARLHPRGRDGRFINVGGMVKWLIGGQPHTGKVTNITTGQNGKPVISVQEGNQTHALKPEQLSEAVKVKARLDVGSRSAVTTNPMDKVRAEAESNIDVEERKDRLRKRVHQNLAERELAVGQPAMGPKVLGGSGTKEDPYVVEDVNEAARLLGEGKHIQLQQPDQVATLLDKLKAIVDDARAKGEAAPNYNLCQVTVPDTNLFCLESKNIPRNHMPQLTGVPTPGSAADKLPRRVTDKGEVTDEVDLSELFVKFLADRGIKVTDKTKPASHLRASQSQLNGATVAGITNYMAQGNQILGSLWTSKDNYIIDGHHRWAADVALKYKTGEEVNVDVREVDADILTLLAMADNFAASMGIPTNTVAGERANPVADEVVHLSKTQPGATFRPNAQGTGIIQPTEGYVVAVPAADNHPAIIDAATAQDRDKFSVELARWLREAKSYREKNPNYHFGFWTDDTGTVYLDITEVLPDRDAAEQAGRERDQIAIWDLAAGTEIPTGGSGAIVEQPVAAAGGTRDNTKPPTGQGVRDSRSGSDDAGGGEGVPRKPHGSTGRSTPASGTSSTAFDIAVDPLTNDYDEQELRRRVHEASVPKGTDMATAEELRARVHGKEPLVARAFTAKQREKAAGTGAAMPDGSYPINNEQDLKNAVQAYGRAKNPEAVKKHIISRAKSLGAVSLLPEEWRKGMKAAGDWNPALHPRGHDGRFIEIGALVHFLIGADDHTGTVTGITDNGDGTTSVSVDEDGTTRKLKPNQILSSVPAKADLMEGRTFPGLGQARLPAEVALDLGDQSALTTQARSLSSVAEEIEADWGPNVNYAARPYLDAMKDLGSIEDRYGADDARSIVAYFLSNARSWRGETAKRVKKELKDLMSTPRGSVEVGDQSDLTLKEAAHKVAKALTPKPGGDVVVDAYQDLGSRSAISDFPAVGPGGQPALIGGRINIEERIADWVGDSDDTAWDRQVDAALFDRLMEQGYIATDPRGGGYILYEVPDDKLYALLEQVQRETPRSTTASIPALLAGGSVVKAESPFLSADGSSWNGEPLPDTVKAALVGPMSKVSSSGAAQALNALYSSLVLNSGGGGTPLDSIIEQVTELDRVAEADGTDGGDAKALQKASKLIRTIFAIPDQADLDRAQERANSKAKSMKPGKSAKAEEAAPEAAADAAVPAEAAPAEAAPAAPGGDAAAEALRSRVHA